LPQACVLEPDSGLGRASIRLLAQEELEESMRTIESRHAIDDELTAKGYIVPGLGDAGDLAFGTKVQM